MDDQVKPLEWRPHRRQILLKPRVLSAVVGAISWKPASGSLVEDEWGLLAADESLMMQKGSAIIALETLSEDGVSWRGRAVDFHGPGTLTGPVAFRAEQYSKPTFPWVEFLAASIGAGLAGWALYYLSEGGLELSKEAIAIWFLVATSLGCLQVWRFAALIREYLAHWKTRSERLAFPEQLDETVGYRRLEVVTGVIEDGVEADPSEDLAPAK